MNDSTALVYPADLYERRLSIFNTVRTSKPPQEITVREFLNDIEDGKYRPEISLVRGAKDKAAADAQKVRLLPAVKPAGVFTGLAAEDLVRHSGMLCLDFDNVGEFVGTFRAALNRDPHVLAVFVSPRGGGLKVLVPVAARNCDEHSRCFEAARAHFLPLLPGGVKLDTAPSNIASNCFVSYDPQLWRAPEARAIFHPAGLKSDGPGCDIDVSHVIESNEKELPSPDLDGSLLEEQELQPSFYRFSHPPDPIRLPGIVDTVIWAKWVKSQPYRAGERNKVIVERVPILLNLVAPQFVALLLLRWFEEAPPGLFKDPRERHWLETLSAIKGCLKSYANARLSETERTAYAKLRDDRQRSAFRICRSLSLAKCNVGRTFFAPCGQFGERLECHSEAASRQLEYLIRNQVIALVEGGVVWTPGERARAARYRWILR